MKLLWTLHFQICLNHKIYTSDKYLIDQFVMQESVNPIDAHISKKEEGEHTTDQSWPPWTTEKWKWTRNIEESNEQSNVSNNKISTINIKKDGVMWPIVKLSYLLIILH